MLHLSTIFQPFSSLFQTYVGKISQSNIINEIVILQYSTQHWYYLENNALQPAQISF